MSVSSIFRGAKRTARRAHANSRKHLKSASKIVKKAQSLKSKYGSHVEALVPKKYSGVVKKVSSGIDAALSNASVGISKAKKARKSVGSYVKPRYMPMSTV